VKRIGRRAPTGTHAAFRPGHQSRFDLSIVLVRVARLNDRIALALYLASGEAIFTTGQCHVIDGGWSN
jgi:hypothetical protein